MISNKYVIYVRKSSEDNEKQVRSLDDQIDDCLRLAEAQGLTVVGEPIKESKSAKIPNNRPLFKELLKKVKAGKIDGIIAWHPDRIARNMIEAGQIIDMLDSGVLKDLKFHSHQFSNDSNGKMLLGMLFVFAKHYSDDLSDKVTRGVTKSLAEGKSSGTRKHGYIRGDDGFYIPDKKNFRLLHKAWEMRAEESTLEEISEFLNANKYSVFSKANNKHELRRINKSTLSSIFRDPFYFGVLNQASQSVNLVDAHGFTPMVDEELFSAVAMRSWGKPKHTMTSKKIFLPLRGLIFCNFCNFDKPMSAGRSRGGGNYKLYYNCRNKECGRTVRSLKGAQVFSEIVSLIKNELNFSMDIYQSYLDELRLYSSDYLVDTRNQLTTQTAYSHVIERKSREIRNSLGKITDKLSIDKANEDLAEYSVESERVANKITELKDKLEKGNPPKLNEEEFRALITDLPNKLTRADLVQKDLIVRNIFLNLHFRDDKLVSYHLKQPFDTFKKIQKVLSGGGGRI